MAGAVAAPPRLGYAVAMSGKNAALWRALDLARRGDVQGAIDALDDAQDDPNKEALMFTLLRATGRLDDAIAAAAARLAHPDLDDGGRSLWSLRRGLLYLEAGDDKSALMDLTTVLRLDQNEHHCEQARVAMARTLNKSSRGHHVH